MAFSRGMQTPCLPPAPLPRRGRFPDLSINTYNRLPKPNGSVAYNDTDYTLLTYSDEIVQAFHLFPFYPLSAQADSGTGCS